MTRGRATQPEELAAQARQQVANGFAIPQQQIVLEQKQRPVVSRGRGGAITFAQVVFGDERTSAQGQWR
jgi:lipoate-protein ligase B